MKNDGNLVILAKKYWTGGLYRIQNWVGTRTQRWHVFIHREAEKVHPVGDNIVIMGEHKKEVD